MNDSPYVDRNTVRVIRQPHHGSIEQKEAGIIQYTPQNGHVGYDDFAYEVCAQGSCDTAQVDVEIEPTIFTVDDYNTTTQVRRLLAEKPIN